MLKSRQQLGMCLGFFMNKFRKLGFIDYNGHLEVHSSLLNVVLHDQPQISAAAASPAAKLARVIDTIVPGDARDLDIWPSAVARAPWRC
jgi:hypothetical protein